MQTIIKYLIIVINIILMSSSLKCQTFMYDGTSCVSIYTDSLFEKFTLPDFPAVLFEKACSNPDFVAHSFEVLCYVRVDTNRKVSKITMYPLYEMGNNLSDTSYIWKNILNSIDSVSKYWVFKPIYHKVDSNYTIGERQYFEEVNNGKYGSKRLPFAGRQVHMFLLDLTLPSWDINNPNFFYYLNLRPNKKE